MSNIRIAFDQMIASVTERVERDPLLPDDIRALMKDKIDALEKGFSAIDRLGNEKLRASTMQAIIAATYVGVYEVAGISTLPGLLNRFQKLRMAPTHAGRRQDMASVKPIIERHACAFWKRNPELKGRPSVTAGRIASAVHKEVLRLPDRPAGWPPDHDLSVDQARNVRDRIRKHLPA